MLGYEIFVNLAAMQRCKSQCCRTEIVLVGTGFTSVVSVFDTRTGLHFALKRWHVSPSVLLGSVSPELLSGAGEEGEAVGNCLLAQFFVTHFVFMIGARRNPH